MDKILKDLKVILIKNNLKLSTAESCTGGLISSFLTDIDGASNFIEQNLVTYAPSAKERFLGVNPNTIKKYGVVSKETSAEMTTGLLKYADCAVSTTGYAGASEDEKNPTGTVYIGLGLKSNSDNKKDIIKTIKFVSKFKDRCAIKEDFAKTAIKKLLDFLEEHFSN